MENQNNYNLPKNKIPVFIGRFQPLHNGHLEVIKWISCQAREFIIVIGSMQESDTATNPLNYQERVEIIKKTLTAANIKNYQIYGLPDFSNDIAWAKKLTEILKKDALQLAVVTLNDWTSACVQKIQIEVVPHPLYGQNLTATRIRQSITAAMPWQEMVPAPVAEFLQNGLTQKIARSQILPENQIANYLLQQLNVTGLNRAVLGVSGGLDSAVTAVIMQKALGKKAIFVWMPFVRQCPFGRNVARLEKAFKIKVEKYI